MNETTFARLATLCKFDFTSKNQAEFIEDLDKIIEFVGKVREFDGVYDDTVDAKTVAVSYTDLREDVAAVTATPEQLLTNTQFENNCYVIPKVID